MNQENQSIPGLRLNLALFKASSRRNRALWLPDPQSKGCTDDVVPSHTSVIETNIGQAGVGESPLGENTWTRLWKNISNRWEKKKKNKDP